MAYPDGEWRMLFDRYVVIFSRDRLPPHARGFDLRCASSCGRRHLHAGTLHGIDPSDKALAGPNAGWRTMRASYSIMPVLMGYGWPIVAGWPRQPCALVQAPWKASDVLRRGIATTQVPLRKAIATVIADTVYRPLVRGAALVEKPGADPDAMPLAPYRTNSSCSIRSEALDRFGTRLEQRFTRGRDRCDDASGRATGIRFSEDAHYWVACRIKV